MSFSSIHTHKVLSTKKLSLSQRQLLLHAGLGFVEYNAITVKPFPFELPENITNGIFTSQNGVHALQDQKHKIQNSFCVGEKTKSLLIENGQNVIKMSQNASELADFLIKKYKNEHFFYFCGNRRRDELPNILSENGVSFSEVIVYQTELSIKQFDRAFDGILFFSPSGVESFASKNEMGESVAFCIGETTASEARKYTDNVIVANATSVESVIAKAAKTFKIVNEK